MTYVLEAKTYVKTYIVHTMIGTCLPHPRVGDDRTIDFLYVQIGREARRLTLI